MATRLTIRVPRDYVLARDVCSYGYFLLSPSHWDPGTFTYSRVLDVGGAAAAVRIRQDGDPRVPGWRGVRGRDLLVLCDRGLERREREEARRQISRMLRLDEPEETIADFHARDPRWKPSGRGRLMRSPTFFEDVIKTVTSCNVAWPSTIMMNTRLCHVLGRGSARTGRAFPTPQKVARTRPGTLRARCRVGYRDRRIVELAEMFVAGGKRGGIDPEWFEDPATPDDALHARLLELPGIGSYAAANIMQLLGRYGRLPLDTESIRHGRMILGFEGTDRQVMQQVRAHFAPFGPHAFRSYWFELWAFYEAKRGPSWTWERETTGKTFTASQLG